MKVNNKHDVQKIITLIKQLSENDIEALMSDSTDSTLTLEELLSEHREVLSATMSHKYLASHDSSNSHLINYYNNNPKLSEVTEKSLQLFLMELIKKVPNGWAVYLRNYKVLFNYAVQRKYIATNPFLGLILPKKQKKYPSYLSPEELDLLLSFIKNDTIKNIITVGFYTGMRRGELLNLRWKNIDLKNQTITIGDENFMTKTRKPRMIPMHQVVKQILEDIKPNTINSNTLVFKKKSGFAYNYDYLTQQFKKAVRKSGLEPNLHFHSLRHSTASNMVQKGVSLYVVKDILGHSSMATTEIYSHLNQDSLRKGINLINSVIMEK